jgi:hypothetical protein
VAQYRLRKSRDDSDPLASDSFMDIVCNMVGIIIILIMVAGIRSARAPRVAAPESPNPKFARLRELEAEALSLEGDVASLVGEIEKVQLAAGVKFEERRLLAQQAEQARQQIAAARQQFDARRRADFDLRRANDAATADLAKLDEELEAAQRGERPSVEVVSYPTPISKTVHGKEIHFQLRGGRIAQVPIDSLLDRLPGEMRRHRDKLLTSHEVTSTCGPIDGFRMQYTIIRDGSYVRLFECQFLPISPQIGEPLEMALADNSEFRRAIAAANPRTATITLWAYPDSFAAYRQLKEVLYKQGFSVAGRPQPADEPIGGSPHGSKSAAE